MRPGRATSSRATSSRATRSRATRSRATGARNGRRLLTLAVLVGAATPTLARRRWAVNPDPTGGAPLDLPPGTEVAVPTSDGGRLAVWVMGPDDGPAVVCAHGWTGERRIWAAPARRLVAAGRRVVVYDQRGHGASTAGHDGLTIAAIGADVASVLEHLDLHDAVVAGHSMGGMAVQSFAIEHSDVLAERVLALALLSTAGAEMGLRALDRSASSLVGSVAVTRAMENPRIGPFLVRGSFGARPALAAMRATTESFARVSPTTRKNFLDAIATMNLHPHLGAIRATTAVVSGTRDTLVPHTRSRRTGALIVGAWFIPIKGAGHQLPFEAPDRLADILIDLGRTESPREAS
ncbi:MAG: alpha/beta hydrolase [Actinomycetota bacterium]|nr:alpha/beta hydrolase [Actinomycetota bacterium]